MALVQKSVEASVGTITLNHPEKHNALSCALISDLLESLTGLANSGARVVILRAPRGAKVWSAGTTCGSSRPTAATLSPMTTHCGGWCARSKKRRCP